MVKFSFLSPPKDGQEIKEEGGRLKVPNHPIIPFIEGDGVGPDIWRATRRVLDAGVEKAYGGKKAISWFQVMAGEASFEKTGDWLPNDTLKAIKHYKVAIKGPLTTPVGGGIRSLNVTMRRELNLYACVRPVRYFQGVPSPVRYPEKMDMIIFRENTEDVYAGIEWKKGSKDVKKVIDFLNKQMGTHIRADSGVGVKPISVTGTKKLIRKAIQYAIDRKRRSVTMVHKGNIMKFTEGSFRDWGYKVAKEEFADVVISEDELRNKYKGKLPKGKILINDRIADSMFQQILTRTDEYDILATPNLNGDYLSDACAAQVGGLGLAPGANIGDVVGLFEATHGTAPKYTGMDKVNPGSLLLSGVMMVEYLGWKKAADLITAALEETIKSKVVTYDLARLMQGAREVKTSEFASAVIKNM